MRLLTRMLPAIGLLCCVLPARCQRPAPPSRLTFGLFAVTPIALPGKDDPRVKQVVKRVQDSPYTERRGVILMAGRGHPWEVKMSNRWLLPGMCVVACRYGAPTALFEITDLGDLIFSVAFRQQWAGAAPGDEIIPREEFAERMPTVRWEITLQEQRVRLERRPIGEEAWRVVYAGTASSFVDPDVLPGLLVGKAYEYRIGAVGERGVAYLPVTCRSDQPVHSPARELVTRLLPAGEARTNFAARRAKFDAMMRTHPHPGTRFSAAWELGSLRDTGVFYDLCGYLDRPAKVEEHSDDELRELVQLALCRMTGQHLGVQRAAWWAWWEKQAGSEE